MSAEASVTLAGPGAGQAPLAASGERATPAAMPAESAQEAAARAAWLAAVAAKEAECERREEDLERERRMAAADREEALYARQGVAMLARDLQVLLTDSWGE